MAIQIGQKSSPGYENPLGLLSDCHRRVESFLNALIRVADEARGERLDERQREGLQTALRYFREAAPKHTQDEEASLFPRLRQVDDPEVAAALHKMEALEADHQRAGKHHDLVEQLGRRWLEQGQLTSSETAEMKKSLAELRDIYQQHIAIEDNEIFPLAGKVLPKEKLTDVGREMAARRGQDADRLAALFPIARRDSQR